MSVCYIKNWVVESWTVKSVSCCLLWRVLCWSAPRTHCPSRTFSLPNFIHIGFIFWFLLSQTDRRTGVTNLFHIAFWNSIQMELSCTSCHSLFSSTFGCSASPILACFSALSVSNICTQCFLMCIRFYHPATLFLSGAKIITLLSNVLHLYAIFSTQIGGIVGEKYKLLK